MPINSKSKGSQWERDVARDLSLWVSQGQRSDLFARTVLSGGQFTISKLGEGQAGDLQANHSDAFEFMKLFLVECKFYKDIGLDKYILDQTSSTFLSKTYIKAKEQATAMKVTPLIIAKQNHRVPIVLTDFTTGMVMKECARSSAFRFHILHNKSMFLCHFEQMVNMVRIRSFLTMIEESIKV